VAGGEVRRVPERRLGDFHQCLLREPRRVRRDQAVLESGEQLQRLVLDDLARQVLEEQPGLVLINVDAQIPDRLKVLQGGDRRARIDERPAPGIDQD
jgi:hypothetical protein